LLRRRHYVKARQKELLGMPGSSVTEETWAPADEAEGAGGQRSLHLSGITLQSHALLISFITLSRRYYVEAQEKELLGTLDTLVAEETWAPADEAGGAGVLRSASSLFGAIKTSLLRCSKYITRGPALLQLMATFQASECQAVALPDRGWV